MPYVKAEILVMVFILQVLLNAWICNEIFANLQLYELT